MLAYSAGLSAPFLVLALFPQYLASLPRSGGWLNTTKVVMGFVELAAAFKFLSAADLVLNEGHIWFTRPLVLAAWVVLHACAGLYLLGKIRLPHDAPLEAVGVGRLWLGMLFLTLALFLSTGLLGGRLPGIIDALLPPAELSGQGPGVVAAGKPAAAAPAGLEWLDDYDAALAQARTENRPIFIDVTGYTCTNCRWMEANIFPLPEVRRLLEQFVLVQLHTDGKDKDRNQKFQVERFGTVELPLYAIMSPDDQEIGRASFNRDPDQFVAFLRKGLARHGAGPGPPTQTMVCPTTCSSSAIRRRSPIASSINWTCNMPWAASTSTPWRSIPGTPAAWSWRRPARFRCPAGRPSSGCRTPTTGRPT
jgi:thiol:disulfide interchange protein DsbD